MIFEIKVIEVSNLRNVQPLYLHLCFLIHGVVVCVNPATVQAAKHLDSPVRSSNNPGAGDVMRRAANRGQINEKVNE